MLKKNLLFLVLLLGFHLSSQAVVDFNAKCKTAFKHCFRYSFLAMNQEIQKERLVNSKNIVPLYIETYGLYLQLNATDDADILIKFKQKNENCIQAFEKEKASLSPFTNYCLVDLYIMQAFVKFKEHSYPLGLAKLKTALSLLSANEKLYKDFPLSNKQRALFNIGFGSIPQQYEWILSMFNFKGSVPDGIAQLNALTSLCKNNQNYSFAFEEVLLIDIFVVNNFGNKTTDKQKLEHIIDNDSIKNQLYKGPFSSFALMAYYQNEKENEKAIEIYYSYIKQVKLNKFPYLDFMMGECLLNKLDFTAKNYFEKYLNEFSGQAYKKSAVQKLAWIRLLQANKKDYDDKIKSCLLMPESMVDADKQATKEAKQGVRPNVYLLQARLLFDGGYYAQARKVLLQKNASEIYTTKAELLEFYYRMGRIYHELKQFDSALKYYKLTMEKGANERYYFAANAALQSALIYEEQRKFNTSKSYFNYCLSLHYDEYQNSISQKAKAGLNRLENK